MTPVIALLTDPAVLDNLEASEAEVDHIFTHPLEALLDPSLAGAEPLVPVGSSDWPYHVEYHVSAHICYFFFFHPVLTHFGSRIHQMDHCRGVTWPIACIAFAAPRLLSKE